MVTYFLWGGIVLCLFSLWALNRHDWLRLTRPARRVESEVIGHRKFSGADGDSYAALYRFAADGAVHEVTDSVYASTRKPPVGTRRWLAYPEGRPDLARPARPLLWAATYAFFIGMGGLLLAKALGWMPL